MTVTLALAAVTILVVFAARCGADSALARMWAAQVRAHEVFDRHERPWEARADVRPRW